MITFNNTYTELPHHFYSKVYPDVLPNISLIKFNHKLAFDLFNDDLKTFTNSELSSFFAGQMDNPEQMNIALAYSGHQFGHFNPTLGDGRAMLLGEVIDSNNQRFDIHIKGSGKTQYSRRADGKSALGPTIREYIVSEAMHALKVPTSRALCVSLSGENVIREKNLPGGIFTRVAKSHIRIGTFQYLSYHRDIEGTKALADYVISRHYPQAQSYLDLLRNIMKNQASMIAKWMSLGFIHGVMNTDNMSISGETIDYGPCAFMDTFHPDQSFSSIDINKRYCYSNQIDIGIWNFIQLAKCFLPLLATNEDEAIDILNTEFQDMKRTYNDYYHIEMTKKIGLPVSDKSIYMLNLFLNHLEENKLDFTKSFNQLSLDINHFKGCSFYNEFKELPFDKDLMRQSNPYFIPRNHLIEKVIQDCYKGNYDSFHQMTVAIENPFAPSDYYEQTPSPQEIIHETFCGT